MKTVFNEKIDMSKDFEKRAVNGDANAQYLLATIYRYGEDNGMLYTKTKQDLSKALYWMGQSANQGNSNGQHYLGTMHYFGHGVPKNYKNAFNWYKKAASQGNRDSQYELGCMYMNGEYVKQNEKTAIFWIKRAADNGRSMAIGFLVNVYVKGLLTIKPCKDEIEYWCKKSISINSMHTTPSVCGG